MIGREVVDVALRSDGAIDPESVRQYIEVRVGQPLSLRAVQNSIKNLHATGDFRDVRVDAAPVEAGTTGSGVIVTFSLLLQYRVGDIELAGLDGLSRTELERALTIRPSDVMSLDAVNDSANAIQERLRRMGYLDATVDTETVFDRPTSRANVILTVNAGPRATVGAVLFEGDRRQFTDDQLIERMRSRTGEPFILENARTDEERIRNFLVNKNHRRADVRFLDHTYDATVRQVALQYRVNAGPPVRVEV